jgi:hypothetical protein
MMTDTIILNTIINKRPQIDAFLMVDVSKGISNCGMAQFLSDL